MATVACVTRTGPNLAEWDRATRSMMDGVPRRITPPEIALRRGGPEEQKNRDRKNDQSGDILPSRNG